MISRPMLFSGEMSRANRRAVNPKTETRRTSGLDKINMEPDAWEYSGFYRDNPDVHIFKPRGIGGLAISIRCPYGVKGDRLWSRETWQGMRQTNTEYDEWESLTDRGGMTINEYVEHYGPRNIQFVYAADNKTDFCGSWLPSIHMPRCASRDEFELIEDPRPERLHTITLVGAIAEGITEYGHQINPMMSEECLDIWRNRTSVENYAALWDSLHGKPKSGKPDLRWAANPWAWVPRYRRLAK